MIGDADDIAENWLKFKYLRQKIGYKIFSVFFLCKSLYIKYVKNDYNLDD
jgi:hypothetical protein